MFKFSRPKPNPSDEKERGDYEALLAESEDATPPIQKRHWSTTRIVFLVLSHLVIGVVGLFVGRILLFSADDFCAHHVNHYCKSLSKPTVNRRILGQLTCSSAPVVRDVAIKWSMQNFNGSFKQKTIYREDPSPEVDAAWDAIGVNCMTSSSSNTYRAYGSF